MRAGTEADTSGPQSALVESSFGDMLDRSVLPSGVPFELMPDTVDVALKVAEANDPKFWRKKLLQVLAVTKSISGVDLHGQEKGSAGNPVDMLGTMLDADVTFLALAWTAEMNGRKIKLSEGIPCPQCAKPFTEISLAPLKVFCRSVAGGPTSHFHQVDDLDRTKFPGSLAEGKIFVGDPQWTASRKSIPENSSTNLEVVRMHRVMCSLYHQSAGSAAPRQVSAVETKKIRMSELNKLSDAMDHNVPRIDAGIALVCAECGMEARIPFEQAI